MLRGMEAWRPPALPAGSLAPGDRIRGRGTPRRGAESGIMPIAQHRGEPARRGPPAMADDTILETRSLTKEFKGFVAVKDVALKIRRGTIHALIGPNGAGKTTCFNLL